MYETQTDERTEKLRMKTSFPITGFCALFLVFVVVSQGVGVL